MLDSNIIPLFYLCSLAGLIMVAGGIFLIYKQKIYIDKTTNQITMIETPIGKFKTNVPALALFALGFFPLVYPIYILTKPGDHVYISGEVAGNSFPVHVYAVVKSESLLDAGQYSIPVPIMSKKDSYKLIFYSRDAFFEEIAELKNADHGILKIPKTEILASSRVEYATHIEEVPHDF